MSTSEGNKAELRHIIRQQSDIINSLVSKVHDIQNNLNIPLDNFAYLESLKEQWTSAGALLDHEEDDDFQASPLQDLKDTSTPKQNQIHIDCPVPGKIELASEKKSDGRNILSQSQELGKREHQLRRSVSDDGSGLATISPSVFNQTTIPIPRSVDTDSLPRSQMAPLGITRLTKVNIQSLPDIYSSSKDKIWSNKKPVSRNTQLFSMNINPSGHTKGKSALYTGKQDQSSRDSKMGQEAGEAAFGPCTAQINRVETRIDHTNSQESKVIVFALIDKQTSEVLLHVGKNYVDFYSLNLNVRKNIKFIGFPQPPAEELFETCAKDNEGCIIIEKYINAILEILSEDMNELSKFLSTDICHASADFSITKSGMLLRKGKLYIGGSKPRHYSIDNTLGLLTYREVANGHEIGHIDLHYSYVCRQPTLNEKPCFMICQYRKQGFNKSTAIPLGTHLINSNGLPDGKVETTHTLYADSEKDRNEWILALVGIISLLRPLDTFNIFELQGISASPPKDAISHASEPVLTTEKFEPKEDLNLLPNEISNNSLRKNSKLRHIAEPLPLPTHNSRESSPKEIKPSTLRLTGLSMKDSLSSSMEQIKQVRVDDHLRIMAQPTPASLVPEPSDSPLTSHKSKDKKKSHPFKDWMKKKSNNSVFREYLSSDHLAVKPSRIVFGVTLEESISVCHVKENEFIPAVMYRCIEYLEVKKARYEEGLYRLSGSSSTIQNLRFRFDSGKIELIPEGDVHLLNSDFFYDVHAIAGLLKLFFRELSEPILTKELRMEFFQISCTLYVMLALPSREDRVKEMKRLVKLLPKINHRCLRVLLVHLIRVVQACDKNKMNVRNISIVFSPTLGIPAGVFTLMMAEYPDLFDAESESEAAEAVRILEFSRSERDPATVLPEAGNSTGSSKDINSMVVIGTKHVKEGSRGKEQKFINVAVTFMNTTPVKDKSPKDIKDMIEIGERISIKKEQAQTQQHNPSTRSNFFVPFASNSNGSSKDTILESREKLDSLDDMTSDGVSLSCPSISDASRRSLNKINESERSSQVSRNPSQFGERRRSRTVPNRSDSEGKSPKSRSAKAALLYDQSTYIKSYSRKTTPPHLSTADVLEEAEASSSRVEPDLPDVGLSQTTYDKVQVPQQSPKTKETHAILDELRKSMM